MLLSIIIPAYNVERYVQACLDSVFALPLSESEMEVLVIDDGSTDSTPQILAKNALSHNNLRVMRQPNQGQSVARNWGIEEAQGEYILFVDSDDALTTPCPLPWEEMKSGKYDMIGLETLFEDAQGRRRYGRQKFPYDQEFLACAEYLKSHNVLGIVYGYVFRTQFIKSNPDLRFTPGIYHQDEEFVVKSFCLGQGFIYKQGYTYIYIKREGSSIHTDTQERKEKLMTHTMIVLRRLLAFAEAQSGRKEVLRCKLGWLTFDTLRKLIAQRYSLRFSKYVLRELWQMSLFSALLRTIPQIITYHRG